MSLVLFNEMRIETFVTVSTAFSNVGIEVRYSVFRVFRYNLTVGTIPAIIFFYKKNGK